MNSALYTRSPGLVDLLDRILDKGLVVAGDIKVSIAHVELLKLQIRLLVCSADKAVNIGLDWWRTDSFLFQCTFGTRNERASGSGPAVRRGSKAGPEAGSLISRARSPEQFL